MEKLHENLSVVNELKLILEEDYPYLEYCEHMSKRLSEDRLEQVTNDYLYVRVKPGMERTNRDESVVDDICNKLSKAINILLMSEVCPSGRFYRGNDVIVRQNINTEWWAFRLYKAKLTTFI